MTKKSTATSQDTDDLDELIDRAVDTFFVEGPSPDELEFLEKSKQPAPPPPEPTPSSPVAPGFAGPSLDEAVDSLFMSAFEEPEPPAAAAPPPSHTETTKDWVTSGDDETDRAIDLAVETLFIEEPDIPAPETAQIDVEEVFAAEEISDDEIEAEIVEEYFVEEEAPAPPPPPPPRKAPPSVPAPPPSRKAPPSAPVPPRAAAPLAKHPPPQRASVTPPPPPARATPPPVPPAPPVRKAKPPAPPAPSPPARGDPTYDDAMAHEIERHMHTMFEEKAPPPLPAPPRPPSRPAAPAAPAASPRTAPMRKAEAEADQYPLRRLQEAILTLEWEISKRSVTALNSELVKVRQKFQDNVTVDFAAMSMRLVLDYVVKRMSRAHPESIRFLLDVTDYLDKSLASSTEDPLRSFHHILTRYETYKQVVRKAEGLPDRKHALADDLGIKDPAAFAALVEAHAAALLKAGKSLIHRISKAKDPENLIRSFRFLVNRSVNRILESTQKGQVQKKVKKPTPGTKA